MGREVKRVPADFDWAINTIWKGYDCNPWYEYQHQCTACLGSGGSPEYNEFKRQWYHQQGPPFDVIAYGGKIYEGVECVNIPDEVTA